MTATPSGRPPSPTPRPVENRPALPEVAYRVGTHADFRAAMVADLSATARPALAGLRTRDPDDPTIALLDAFAVVCDVLTFYTERLVNEAFLRTASERTSLAELGRLVAYRLDPGVAAQTHLAFTLERPPALPASLPADPGLAPPAVPAAVVLPAGLRVTSVPGPGELPQTFETVEEVPARPEWNVLPVAATRPHLPTFGRRDAWVAGTGHRLGPGDVLLLAGRDLVHDRWDVRVLDRVVEDLAGSRTHLHWDRGLGSFQPPNDPAAAPELLVLRRRLTVFGHNAPEWRPMVTSFRTHYAALHGGAVDQADWPGFAALGTGREPGTLTVDVDGSHPEVVRGSWVVVSQEVGGFYRELYEVVEVAELSRSEFAVSGPVTRLTLAGEAHVFGTPRQVTVLAVTDPLTLVEAPDPTTVAGSPLVVDGDATGMAPGRRLLVAGRTADGELHAEVVTLARATPAPGGRTSLQLDPAPRGTYERAGAVVYGNVALATHGQTVQQLLGGGEARRAFQTFALADGPLTHVQADTPRGSASTLVVRVDDVGWREQDSLYGAEATDRAYVTRDEPDGSTVVAFGDGVHGARLPSGSHNVRATYRTGLGRAGNVAAGALSQPVDRPLGLRAVTNPAPATGGVDPEPEAHARRSIPLPVRTLGRAVSLLDYADLALAFTGVGAADAAVRTLRSGRTVVVSVTGPDGAAVGGSTVEHLQQALRDHGDPHVAVVVLPARLPVFRLALRVTVAADREPALVLAAAEAALRGAYGAAVRDLGAPVHRSAVTATAAAVPGVLAVDVDRLYRGSTPSLRQRLVAEAAGVDAAGNAVAAELLGLSPEQFDWLEETS